MSISNAQRDRLRTHPHLAKHYLSVLVPGQVYCGTVGGAPSRGDRDITVVDVSGNIANVLEGQTVLVGTSCGDDSISRRRFRSRAGQVLTLDENSVDWQVGDFVTVIQHWELWSVYPRIIETAPDVWTFYKDYDVTYTDENLEPPPVAIAGPHKAGFLSGGSVVFTIDASDSYAVADGASISTYAWTCTGGSITNANAATTTITFDTAGTYWLTLTVTDDNGKAQTTRRVIFVHDRTGANAPYTDLEFPGAVNGDWERGGWEMRIDVRGDASGSDFPDGTLVVLWQESWYSGTEEEIDGNVRFAGYIRKESVEADWDIGAVTFEAATIESLLKQCPMFSVGIQVPLDSEGKVDKRDPVTWYEYDYDNMTVATAVHHLWRWHSTLLGIADVYLPVTDNTLLLKACDDFARGNLYGQVDNFARQYGIFAHVACNRKGQVYLEEDVNLLTDAERAAVPLVWNGGLLEQDRRGRITIVREIEAKTAHVHLSGFSFDGTDSTPIIAQAPGEAPEPFGRDMKNYERQVLDDTTQAAELAGRVLAAENNEYKDVRIDVAGNYTPFDIVPQEWIQLSLAAGDTPREIVWTNEKFVCRRVDVEVDAGAGTAMPNCVFEREAGGPSGVSEEYTPAPPPPPPPPPVWQGAGDALLAFDEAEGCWYLGPEAPEWEERDAGLPAGAVDNDNQGGWDAWWFTPEKQGTENPDDAIIWRVQDGDIFRSENCGVTWVRREPDDDPPNSWGDSPAPTVDDLNFIQRADNIHVIDEHYFLAEWQNASGDWRGWIAITRDDGISWEWMTLCGATYIPPYFYAREVCYQCVDHKVGAVYHQYLLDPSYPNFDDALGAPDGNFFRISKYISGSPVANGCTTWRGLVIYVDFGITPTATPNISSYSRGTISNRFPTIYGNNDPDAMCNPSVGGWVGLGWAGVENWYHQGADWDWQVGADVHANYRYFQLRTDMETADPAGLFADFQAFRLYTTSPGSINQVRPIWMDVDTEDGSTLIATVFEGPSGSPSLGRLYGRKYKPADRSYAGQLDLKAAWLSEVENRDYIAYPFTPLGDKEYVVFFGKMRGPFSLANPAHVIRSLDDGDTWSAIESSWGTDTCSALQIGEDQGGTRVYTGIRWNPTTKASSLHRGVDSLSFVVSTPFVVVPSGVNVDALTISRDGTKIAIGSDSAGEIVMVACVDVDDLVTWIDLTSNYPTTGAVRSLVYL